MRWKAKPIPKIGDTRVRYPFAWLPTKAGDYTVWLERYWVKEKLEEVLAFDEGMVRPVQGWMEIDRDTATYSF